MSPARPGSAHRARCRRRRLPPAGRVDKDRRSNAALRCGAVEEKEAALVGIVRGGERGRRRRRRSYGAPAGR